MSDLQTAALSGSHNGKPPALPGDRYIWRPWRNDAKVPSVSARCYLYLRFNASRIYRSMTDNQSRTTFRRRWFHSNWLPKLLRHE